MFAKRYWAMAALCGASLITTSWAAESSPANAFRPDDEVVAAVSGARLMRGSSTFATVAQGQTLRVLKVEGPWVGTAVTVNGQKIGGWIWSRQVMTPRQYQSMTRSARRYSYQPVPVFTGPYYGQPTYSQPFAMGVTPYGELYWRADHKIVGY